MSIPAEIIDGFGTGNRLKVNGEGEISVSVHTHPPIDEELESYPFSQFMTDTGDASGSNDLIVNGSTTNQNFYIKSSNERDIFIKSISIRIGDSGTVNLSRFGGLSALSNGVEFFYSNNSIGKVVIQDEMQTNLDLLRIGSEAGAVGSGVDAYLLDVQGGGSEETYLPIVDLSSLFGFPWGLKLSKNSNDQIGFTVKDNLSGLITFNIKAFGIQI